MSITGYGNQWVCDLVPYEPGKPIEETARELGLEPDEIVKLASNENPLGPSPKAKLAMAEAIENAHIYPDGGGYRLRTALAEKHGVAFENIVLGNGSNEIIELLCHSFLKPGAGLIAADALPSAKVNGVFVSSEFSKARVLNPAKLRFRSSRFSTRS